MSDLQKSDGELAARVRHALAQPGDTEGLARWSASEEVERPERFGAIDEVRGGDVAEVGVAETAGQHRAGEILDLSAP
jgi:hypothetical protein|nr:hypothetical protein [Sphingobium yanoikuyae]